MHSGNIKECLNHNPGLLNDTKGSMKPLFSDVGDA